MLVIELYVSTVPVSAALKLSDKFDGRAFSASREQTQAETFGGTFKQATECLDHCISWASSLAFKTTTRKFVTSVIYAWDNYTKGIYYRASCSE